MSTVAPFAVLTLDELFALELPLLDYAVDGILPLGALTMLAAREKAGKSLLAVDLCCSVALGEPFLDRAVRPGPALLIPAEENVREVRSRIEARLGGLRGGPVLVLPVNGFTDDVLRLDDPGTMERLYATVLEYEPVVVVLDPMRELHGLREDVADDMGPLLRPLRQLAHQTNTAVVLNHHMNRQGSARGSTAIRAAVDQEWAFRRTDGQDDTDSGATKEEGARGVIVVEGRYGPRQTITLRLGAGLRWEAAEPLLVEPGASSAAGRVLAFLRTASDWAGTDGIATATGDPKKTVQNAIAELLRRTPSPIVTRGSGRKNDPRQFRAVDPPLFGPDGETGQPRTEVEEMVPGAQSPRALGAGNHCRETEIVETVL